MITLCIVRPRFNALPGFRATTGRSREDDREEIEGECEV